MSKVVADSSFYICFLDDIKRPKYLVRILNHFEFIIGKVIHEEIKRSQNYSYIKTIMEEKVIQFEYENYGEILKPFFSIKEIQKGEHEVIAISIILVRLGFLDIIIIIDDKDARKFIERNFKDIYHLLKYTVKFIVECYSKYKIFSKEEVKEILTLIKGSKFRVKGSLIDDILKNLEGS